MIQTFVPDHYAIRPVREHDYEAFYRAELEQRAALGYPPFGRLVHVLVSGPEEAETLAAAERLAQHARERGAAPRATPPSLAFAVLGPGPVADRAAARPLPLPVAAEGQRREARARRGPRARGDRASARETGGVRIQVDANPVNML